MTDYGVPRSREWKGVRGVGSNIVTEEYSWVFRVPVFDPAFCDWISRAADKSENPRVILWGFDAEIERLASQTAVAVANRVLSHIYSSPVNVDEATLSVVNKEVPSDWLWANDMNSAWIMRVCVDDDCDGGEYTASKYGEESMRVVRPTQGYAILHPAAVPVARLPITHGRCYELTYFFNCKDGDFQCDF